MGVTSIFFAGLELPGFSHSMVLTYAEIMAWAGIVVIVFGILKANMPFKRTIKKTSGSDELAQLIQGRKLTTQFALLLYLQRRGVSSYKLSATKKTDVQIHTCLGLFFH